MIRVLSALAIALQLASAAGAAPADWFTYTNPSWGYVLSVPPGYVARKSSAGEPGAVFGGPASEIMVWGEAMTEPDLEAKGDSVLRGFFEAGWGLMYQNFTPQGVSIEMRKGATVLHVRLIPVCDGKGVAQYRYGYTVSDGPRLTPLQEEMLTEFKAAGACSAI